MHIALITEKKYYEIFLPDLISGKFWIVDEEGEYDNNRLLGIEAMSDGQHWIAKSTDAVAFTAFTKSGQEDDKIVFEEGGLYPILLGPERERSFLIADNLEEGNELYVKYRVTGPVQMIIGKDPQCDIIYHNNYVSSAHARLSYQNGSWMIQDYESKNGVYVNKHRVNGNGELSCGDIIYIFGMKIIIGGDFFAINNPGNSVTVRNANVAEYSLKEKEILKPWKEKKENFYYRSPRFQRDITPLELKVDMPSQRDRAENTPIFLTLMPAMLMGVASFSSGLVTTINTVNNGGKIITSLPTLVMSISMLIGMVVFPFIMKSRDKKNKKEKEEIRRERYHKYLLELKKEISRNIKVQEEILRENEPNIIEFTNSNEFWKRKLWYKTPQHSDFLWLRLGVGNVDMYSEIKFPEERFSIDDDVLKDDLFNFQKEERLLKNVPICIPLKEERVVGIVGNDSRLVLVNNILAQLAVLHSYNEVKIVCITESRDFAKLGAIRFAHHIWDNEENFRFFATNEDNARELSIQMNRIISNREEEGEKGDPLPYYVVISTSKSLEKKCTFINEILSKPELPGFMVITAYEELKDLPKECNSIIEINEQMGMLSQRDASKPVGFMQDPVSSQDLEKIVFKTSGYKLDLQQGRFNLPSCISFLDMYKVGKFEYLNVRERWKNNNPVLSLQAPVGVDTNGETFYLDLHEKFHGPHGLVAGMTGSGKSEFIITYVLSLAVNYHPNEVAFVLIDYKGGGLVGAFENEHYRLPHLAGTITNLDLSAITRSILSIKSELKRRQNMFNIARDIANEGTMDIYKYQKMFRQGLVKEPLPHLFIISDEFAELKSQQPEFLDQLISTARIGRSLGVHLILATQKPSGVVNEQIWANSKFKVCLKVQDRSDSMDMLKRPDAASLIETGRFYLQVGYNELFELGQSAWCGAAYTNSDDASKIVDGNIEMLDNLGNTIEKLKPSSTDKAKENGKQIVRIMEYLTDLAKTDSITERQLWLPTIPADITLEEVLTKYSVHKTFEWNLNCIIGELDDPYTQSQRAFSIDFSKEGNLLIYGSAGSGKELLLTTMLLSLYREYTAAQLNTFVIDFGAESLNIFNSAPQMGNVFLSGDEDKITTLFTMLEKEVKVRKKLLSGSGLNFREYNETAEEKLPFILLIVNNYTAFVEENEWAEKDISTLTRECTKYGIFVVATSTSASGVRFRVAQNFGRFLCMQLNDKSDYTTILGRTQGVYPSAIYGRGILKQDEVYEFQVALPTKNLTEQKDYILKLCGFLSENDESRAKGIPEVEKNIDFKKLITGNELEYSKLPVGVGFANYEPANWDFHNENIVSISSMDAQLAFGVSFGLLKVFAQKENTEFIFLNINREMEENFELPHQTFVDKYDDIIVRLFMNAVTRNNAYKRKEETDMHPIVCLIQDPVSIQNRLDVDKCDKFKSMMIKTFGFTNMFFIIVNPYKDLVKLSMESWYQDRCSGNGFWAGAGIGKQIALKIQDTDYDLNGKFDLSSGFIVYEGKAKHVRFVSTLVNAGGEDDE